MGSTEPPAGNSGDDGLRSTGDVAASLCRSTSLDAFELRYRPKRPKKGTLLGVERISPQEGELPGMPILLDEASFVHGKDGLIISDSEVLGQHHIRFSDLLLPIHNFSDTVSSGELLEQQSGETSPKPGSIVIRGMSVNARLQSYR